MTTFSHQSLRFFLFCFFFTDPNTLRKDSAQLPGAKWRAASLAANPLVFISLPAARSFLPAILPFCRVFVSLPSVPSLPVWQ